MHTPTPEVPPLLKILAIGYSDETRDYLKELVGALIEFRAATPQNGQVVAIPLESIPPDLTHVFVSRHSKDCLGIRARVRKAGRKPKLPDLLIYTVGEDELITKVKTMADGLPEEVLEKALTQLTPKAVETLLTDLVLEVSADLPDDLGLAVDYLEAICIEYQARGARAYTRKEIRAALMKITGVSKPRRRSGDTNSFTRGYRDGEIRHERDANRSIQPVR